MNFFKLTTGLSAALMVVGAIASPATAQMQIRLIQRGPAAETEPAGQSTSPEAASPADTTAPAANVVTPSVPRPEAAQPGEPPYDRFMRLGYAASETGDYQEAMTYFRQALDANPGDRLATIAYWNMVDALQTIQVNVAEETAEVSEVNSPTAGGGTSSEAPTFDEYMNAGYAAVKRNNYQQALGYFQRAQQIRPDNPYANQAIRNVQTYLQ
ncbi:MAG: tetratricopeptide repeat protein [Synechococcales bacterium]|nr:tetratricopeptide repeat protein [Synechococcales bacterium]